MASEQQQEEAVAAAQEEMLRLDTLHFDDGYDVSNVRHQDVPAGYRAPTVDNEENDLRMMLDTGEDVLSPREVNMVRASDGDADAESAVDASAHNRDGPGQEGVAAVNNSVAGTAQGMEAQEGAHNEACVEVHKMLHDAVSPEGKESDKVLGDWLKMPLRLAATGRGAALEEMCDELSKVVVSHLDGYWKAGPPKLNMADTDWKANVEQVVSALLQVREVSRK